MHKGLEYHVFGQCLFHKHSLGLFIGTQRVIPIIDESVGRLIGDSPHFVERDRVRVIQADARPVAVENSEFIQNPTSLHIVDAEQAETGYHKINVIDDPNPLFIEVEDRENEEVNLMEH